MQVKFIGNPADPSDNRGFIVWAGERFELNVVRELPEGKAFAKIPTNSHFQVVEESWDHDPTVTTTDTPDRAALIAEAETLGVKIDKRWSAEKIAKAIQQAKE